MPIAPHKADPPLLIDADRVLPLPVASQSLQLITGRRSKDPKFRSGMQLEQFPQCHALEGTEALAVLVVEKLLGVLRAEALNHTLSIQRQTLYVKRLSSADTCAGLEPVPTTAWLTSATGRAHSDSDFSTHFHSLTKSSQHRQLVVAFRLPPVSFESASRRSNKQAVNSQSS